MELIEETSAVLYGFVSLPLISSILCYSPNLFSPNCSADNNNDNDNYSMSHILSLKSRTENLLL